MLRGANWINASGNSIHKCIIERLGSESGRGDAVEEFITYYLALALRKKPKANQIFTFHGDLPTWHDHQIELVGLEINDGKLTSASFVDPCPSGQISGPFASRSKTYKDDIAYYSDPRGIPFLYPCSHHGPDIVAVVRSLKNQRLIFLTVQTKFRDMVTLPSSLTEKSLKSLSPTNYYVNKVCLFSLIKVDLTCLVGLGW